MATKKRVRRPYYAQNVQANVKNQSLKAKLQVDPYRDAMTESELRELRRSLAKVANQRIVRLERAQSAVTGESYASYGAIDLVNEYLKGRKRYSESLKYGTKHDVQRDIISLQTFIASKSSTVAGQKDIEKKRIATFEKKGVHFASNREFYDFLKSSTFRELSKTFDSNQIVEFYEQVRQGDASGQVAQEAFDEALQAFRSKQAPANLKSLAALLGVAPLK